MLCPSIEAARVNAINVYAGLTVNARIGADRLSRSYPTSRVSGNTGDAAMKPHEIERAIRDKLDGPVHEYAAGFSRTDWNDIIVEVQTGRCTIDQAVDTINTWFVDYPPEVEPCSE